MILIMSDIWFQAFADTPERRFDAGASLFRRGDPVRSAYLVRTGEAALRRTLSDGAVLTLRVAGPGELVADAALFSEHYHCEAVCETPTVVAVLGRSELRATLTRRGLAMDALAASAHQVQALRTRLEVMRLRRVRDRLTAYLDLHGEPEKGDWIRVADWIGVTAPALYRELARRRAGPSSHT